MARRAVGFAVAGLSLWWSAPRAVSLLFDSIGPAQWKVASALVFALVGLVGAVAGLSLALSGGRPQRARHELAEGNKTLRLLGGAIMSIGALIATTCGLCTGVVIFLGLSTMSWKTFTEGSQPLILVPLMTGALPAACGLGLLVVGWVISSAGRAR